MTIVPLSVFFQKHAKDVLWRVDAGPQAIRTGEHSSSQRCWVGRLEGSRVPLVRRAKVKNSPLRPPIRGAGGSAPYCIVSDGIISLVTTI